MTRLLVSVRSGEEANAAVLGGADLIDVKEPNLGALGPASPAVWQEVADRIPSHMGLSVAAGELVDYDEQTLSEVPSRVSLVKFGLAHCAERLWHSDLQRMSQQFSQHCRLVAVIYADAQGCGAPSPIDIVEAAIDLKCGAILVDTWLKDGSGLLDHADVAEIGQWFQSARQAGMMTVVAGSITAATLPDVLLTNPDVVAVRGAACAGPREGRVNVDRVSRLKRALQLTCA